MENKLNYEPVAYLTKEQAARFTEFLKFSGIENVSNELDHLSGSYVISTLSADFEKAQNLFHIFSENELEDAKADDSYTSSAEKTNLYESSAEKYSDNLSSAITFLVCGVIGLCVLLLDDFNVIHLFNSSGAFFILTNLVLGGLFIVFIIIGLKSFSYSKRIKSQIAKENEINQQITEWLQQHITKEMIEASYDNEIPEEMKYFSRSEYLKKAIQAQFTDIEDGIIESVSDNYIEELF